MSSEISYVYDGLNVSYCPSFIDKDRATSLFEQLEKELEYFTGDLSKVKVFGKWHDIPRKQVAFGDDGVMYKYSGLEVPALPWPKPLLELRDEIFNHDATKGMKYNFVLVNRYNDGNDYIGKHRDDEKELDKDAAIVSISLGAVREMVFHQVKGTDLSKSPLKISLGHGSCLIMKPPTNKYWYHSIPKRKTCNSVRINLTFRKIINIKK